MRILLVEDDKNLSDTLNYHLKKEGYTVDVCLDGIDGLYCAKQQSFDILLLDRMLPGCSGTEIVSKLRESGDTTPVLMLTALGTTADRVEGLDTGADDYLVKPFDVEELMARIRSLTRRSTGIIMNRNNLLVYKDLSYQTQSGDLTGAEGTCTLSKKEGSLLEIFLRNPNQTLSRSQLLTKVWGFAGEVEDGNLDNYIFFLRRRFKNVSSEVTISTVRGIGYRMS